MLQNGAEAHIVPLKEEDDVIEGESPLHETCRKDPAAVQLVVQALQMQSCKCLRRHERLSDDVRRDYLQCVNDFGTAEQRELVASMSAPNHA